MERSTLRMHACMMSSDPPILYWKAGTLAAYEVVRRLRSEGLPCYATMDAGPNVKVLCRAADVEVLRLELLRVVDRVELLQPGPGARLVPSP
jgi:diphosphomevalonate decarboxylase